MKIFSNIKLSPETNSKLRDLSVKRKSENNLIKTQQAIVADLIDRAFKKECKQCQASD